MALVDEGGLGAVSAESKKVPCAAKTVQTRNTTSDRTSIKNWKLLITMAKDTVIKKRKGKLGLLAVYAI